MSLWFDDSRAAKQWTRWNWLVLTVASLSALVVSVGLASREDRTLSMIVGTLGALFAATKLVMSARSAVSLEGQPSIDPRVISLFHPVGLPIGLRPVYQYGGFGGPLWCTLRPGRGLGMRSTDEPCIASTARELTIALEGFDAGRTAKLQIIKPTGAIVEDTVAIDDMGKGEWNLAVAAGDTIGRYEVVVDQGDTRAAGDILVSRPDMPRALVSLDQWCLARSSRSIWQAFYQTLKSDSIFIN